MLALLFSLGTDRYALPALAVREVVPCLKLKALPGTPDYVAGLANYRGNPLPVIDLSALARGVPCPPLLSTRLLVVDYDTRPLGLLAEEATETATIPEESLQPAGVATEGAPWLGPVATASGQLVQLVTVGDLLTPEAAALLYREAEAP